MLRNSLLLFPALYDEGMFKETGDLSLGEVLLIPLNLGETESLDAPIDNPVAETGEVEVAIVVFVDSEYGVYRGLVREENIGP